MCGDVPRSECGWYTGSEGARTMPLRHALFHGRCDQRSDVIDVLNGGLNTTTVEKVEFCRYRIIVLVAGVSNWLSHMAEAFLCNSLVLFVADSRTPSTSSEDALAQAISPFSSLLRSNWNYVRITMNSTAADATAGERLRACSELAEKVRHLLSTNFRSRTIAERGTRLVREKYTPHRIREYIDNLFGEIASRQTDHDIKVFIRKMRGVPVDESNYTSIAVNSRRWVTSKPDTIN